MAVQLAKASPEDIPLLRRLATEIWWAHYPGIISDAQIEYMLEWMYSAEKLHAQMTEEGHEFWLVVADGQVVGYVGIQPTGDRVYFVQKFYLKSNIQRQGIGYQTFNLILEQYPDLRELRLYVNRRNYKSVNFYFKVGFVIESWIDQPFGEDYIMDDFLMVWKSRTK